MASDPSTPGHELVKMSVLARLSEVPAATIKHYIREGLLPQPDVRTSKNMALYDVRLVERVKAIKELQRSKFLPLKVIKGVLDGVQPDTDEETAQAIQKTLDEMTPHERRSRAQLLDAGAAEEDLEFLRLLGLLVPEVVNGHEIYSGDDLRLLRLLGEARKAGLSAAMLPPSILDSYARAIRELVRTELQLFREGVIPQAGDNLKGLAETATRLSEQLVVILRRKMLLPMLKQATSTPAPPDVAPGPKVPSKTPASREKKAHRKVAGDRKLPRYGRSQVGGEPRMPEAGLFPARPPTRPRVALSANCGGGFFQLTAEAGRAGEAPTGSADPPGRSGSATP
jgi:DNA-binding transcriptional MerR regulator